MTSNEPEDILNDSSLQSLLVACLEKLERGESLDREAILNQHPEFAGPLGEFLDDQAMLREVAGGMRESIHGDSTGSPAAARIEETLDSRSDIFGLPVGDVIRYVGEYEVLEEIARGGMGVVFRARHRKLNRTVALKMILSGRLAADSDVERFVREAQAAAKLKHPNIVAVHEVGRHQRHHYFTMDFISGHSLAEEIRDESLPPRRAAELIRTIADAVDFAHQQGTLHRDLKPANILIDAGGQPHITDFGLAKMVSSDDVSEDLTATGQVLGTPSYMSPEQAAGKSQSVGTATDIYSLGAVLYACLTGRAPFVADSALDTLAQVVGNEPVAPCSLNTKVPKDLETISLKCLEKEPHRRYGTAQQLADDLERYLTGRPVHARPIGPAARTWRWCRRNPVVAGLSSALILLLIGAAVVSTTFAWVARENANIARKNEETAMVERRRANQQAELATRMAETANYQKELAEKQSEQLRWEVHAGNIADAQRALMDNKTQEVLYHLSQCRWDYCGWEHDYIYTQLHLNQQTYRGHTDVVFDVAVSPDGQTIASASKDGTVRVWDVASGEQWLAFADHQESVGSVAFTPDGRHIISGSWDQTVKIWDYRTGKVTRTIEASDFVSSIAISPSGDRVVADDDSRLCVWDTATGDLLLSLPAHQDHVTCIAFSKDGKYLASGSLDHTVKIWDASSGDQVHLLEGHARLVTSVSFSPDGKRLATAASDRTAKIWDVETGQEIVTLRGHAGFVDSVAFSRDGRRIATGGHLPAPTIKIWDASTYQLVKTLKGHQHNVRSLAWHSDGQHLISGSTDQTVKRWDTTKQTPPLTWKAHNEGFVRGLDFSPDGRRIASCSGQEPEARIWDLTTGQEQVVIEGGCNDVAFSPDGKQLAIISGSTMSVCDASTGEQLFRSKNSHGSPTRSVTFSNDGTMIASTSGSHYTPPDVPVDHSIKIWDARTGAEIHTLRGHTQSVSHAAFSPDGRRIASASMDDTVKIWDTTTGQELHTLDGHTGWVQCVTFSPDGTHVASGCFYGEIKIWDINSGREVRSLTGHTGAVSSLAYSPSGRRIASGANNGERTVRIWETTTGQEVLRLEQPSQVDSVTFCSQGNLAVGLQDGSIKIFNGTREQKPRTLYGHRGDVNSVAFSHEGRWIASGGGDAGTALYLWNAVTGRRFQSPPGMRQWVTSVAFSPDDRLLGTASKGKTVRLWNIDAGREAFALEGHEDEVTTVAFSPDGAKLATASADRTIRIWDLASRKTLFTLRGHTGVVKCLAFHPDGHVLVSGSADKSIKTWNTESGEPVHAIADAHSASVTDVAFTLDGKHLASGSHDKTIRIWNFETKEAVRTLQGHSVEVTCMAFSPDGRRLISGSTDQTLREWDWTTGRETRVLRAHTGEITSVAFDPSGERIISGSADKTVKVWEVEGRQP